MREQDAFVVAEQAMCDVVSKIRDDQWDLPIPDWFRSGQPGKHPTLRAIINFHAYDDAWVPDTLAGKTVDEVGDRYDGDLLGDAPKEAFRAIANKAIEATLALDDPDQVVHLRYGDYPAREYLKHITSFRGFRVYDLAKVIGGDTTMPAALVQGLFDVVIPHVEEWRTLGVFGPEIPVPEGADPQTRLLCLAGHPL
jgi:uncharacterized protein (TIGR03086 family)